MKANLIFFLAIFIVSALFIGHFRLTFSPFSVSLPYWHRTVGVILIVVGCLVYNIGEHINPVTRKGWMKAWRLFGKS